MAAKVIAEFQSQSGRTRYRIVASDDRVTRYTGYSVESSCTKDALGNPRWNTQHINFDDDHDDPLWGICAWIHVNMPNK